MSNQVALKKYLEVDMRSKFEEIIGKNPQAYISSVLTAVSSNDLLKKADPQSVVGAALMAATLNLPVNANLGFAYIVPFGKKAQLQIGYKGYIQLAQRSGKFKNIGACEIYKDQIVSQNPLTGYEFDFSVLPADGEKPVGYASYFELLNGFEKTVYISAEEMEKHAKTYSQTYKRGFGVWKDNFKAMAIKTVIKSNLSKWAPLSIDMQKAVMSDHGDINPESMGVKFPDNNAGFDDAEIVSSTTVEQSRLIKLMGKCKTKPELEKFEPNLDEVTEKIYTELWNKL